MITWYNLPKNIPNDAETVWVRVKYFYGEPFEATYDITLQEFVSIDNNLTFPVYVIARWGRET
jgi:hypothetical protein